MFKQFSYKYLNNYLIFRIFEITFSYLPTGKNDSVQKITSQLPPRVLSQIRT